MEPTTTIMTIAVGIGLLATITFMSMTGGLLHLYQNNRYRQLRNKIRMAIKHSTPNKNKEINEFDYHMTGILDRTTEDIREVLFSHRIEEILLGGKHVA